MDRDARWLNIGCGMHPAPRPWTNIDAQPLVDPDIVARAQSLPFKTGSVDWLYAGHVFEHMAFPDDVTDALVECRRVLSDQGRLCIVGPDCDRALQVEGLDVRYHVIDGGHQWEGDAHLWTCSERVFLPIIRQIFPLAFPVDISVLSFGWPTASRSSWQMAVLACK